MSNNKVKDWSEFDRLKELANLEDLLFAGNPLQEKHFADGGMHAHSGVLHTPRQLLVHASMPNERIACNA